MNDQVALAFAADLERLWQTAIDRDEPTLAAWLAGAANMLRVITHDEKAIDILSGITACFGGVDQDALIGPAAPVVQLADRRPR